MINFGRPEKRFLRLDHPISEPQLGPEHFHCSYKRLEVTADRTWSGNEAGLVKTITQRSSSLKRMSRYCAYGMTAVGDCRAFQRTACAFWERARGTCSDSVISALKDREPSKTQFNEGPHMQKLLQHLSPPRINLALRLLPLDKPSHSVFLKASL